MTSKDPKSIVLVLTIILSACLSPLRAQEGDPAPEPISQTTEFLQPLEQHQLKLEIGLDGIIDLLDLADPETEEEAETQGDRIEAAGRAFLKEGRALQSTVKRFMRGETRRGLDLEVSLIREEVQICQQALVTYRQACGAPFVAIDDSDETTLRQTLRSIIEEEIRARIAARLEAEGLKDIVDAKSWEEAREAVERQVSEKVRERIEKETERIFGMRFHDRATAKQALRRRINLAIERKVEQILVRISGSGLVVEVAGAIVASWAKDQLWNRVWPEIREAFRQKGRHESRLARSCATMRAARMRLMELEKTARIRDVEARIRDARRTVAAARYLRRDLEGASKMDLLGKLEADITWLQKAVSFTRRRFLLHKEDLVNRLKVDQDVLGETLDELERLIKGVEVPTWADNKLFFIRPIQRLTKEGLVYTGFGGAESSRTFLLGSSLSLHIIDLDEAEKTRAKLAKKGRDAESLSLYELSRESNRVVKRYTEPFLARLVMNGQVRHLQHTKGLYSSVGGGGIYGLAPGNHQFSITIVTPDGFRFDETSSLEVKPWDEQKNKIIASNRRGVTTYTEALDRAATDHDLRGAAVSLAGQYSALSSNLLMYSTTALDEIMPMFRRRLELAALILRMDKSNERRNEEFVSRLSDLVRTCAGIGNASANALAAEAARLAEQVANPKLKRDSENMAAIWRSMANLAISSGNDVATAHEHLENWLRWFRITHPKMDEERMRGWWPEPIQLGAGEK